MVVFSFIFFSALTLGRVTDGTSDP